MASQRARGWRNLSTSNAFFIHLALSLLVFATLVMLMITLWYPGKLFFLDGGWEGLKLVALVDLVLGPALTLMLFKPGKKNLGLDMSLIAGIQVAALAYGFATTYAQRSVAVVYAENQFFTLANSVYERSNETLKERNIKPKSIEAIDNRAPATLLTTLPEGGTAKYIEELLNGLPQQHERSDLFIAAKGNSDQIRDEAISAATLQEQDKKGLVKKALAKQDQSADISVHKFTARYGSGFALFDHTHAKIVDYIEIKDEPPNSKTSVAESAE